MHSAYLMLYFLNSFTQGFIAPILTLLLCLHGANITTAAMFLSLYTIAVVVTEVPSGILSDYIGRKKILTLSQVFGLACFVLMQISSNFDFIDSSYLLSCK